MPKSNRKAFTIDISHLYFILSIIKKKTRRMNYNAISKTR